MGNKNSGRNPKPVDLNNIEKLASLGVTVLQIAHFFDMTEKSFYRKAEKDPEIMNAVNRGRARGIVSASGKLYQKMQEGDTKAIMFFLRARAGWNDSTLHVDHTFSEGMPKSPIANYRELLNEFYEENPEE